MKIYYLLALIMFLDIKCQGNNSTTNQTGIQEEPLGVDCEGKSSSSYETCEKKISQDEREAGFNCCLLKGKKGGADVSICTYLDPDDSKNIGEVERDREDNENYESVSIICDESNSNSQSVIKFNSFLLILLFLLFN